MNPDREIPDTNEENVEAELVAELDREGPPPMAGVVAGTGQVYNPATMELRQMPDKELGKHRFAALATFYLSPEQAEAAHAKGNRVLLDPSNLLMYGIVCVDCDTPYTQVRTTCPAKPSEWWS